MIRKFLALLALCAAPLAFGQCLTSSGKPLVINGAACVQVIVTGGPLALPLIHASDLATHLVHIGSFKLPAGNTGITNQGSALTVNGNTIWVTGNYVDPYGSGNYLAGIGSATIPATLDPGYTGAAATAALVTSPVRAANIVAPVSYTTTSPINNGATSATFTSVPGGIAANAGWYIKFVGSNTVWKAVTGVSSNTLSWSGGLSGSSYGSSALIYQWQPLYPFGNASGDSITGALVSGGKLYLTGGSYYDGTCAASKGWILTANTDGSSWGSVNTVLNQVVPYSRRYAAQLQAIPVAWQSLLGSKDTMAIGGYGLSISSCQVPAPYNLTAFNLSDITGGNAVPVVPELDYFFGGLPSANYPEALEYRNLTFSPPGNLSGPFPLSTAGTYPMTLSSTPTMGDTSETISLPSSTVSATATLVNGSVNLVITAISSGTISNSGIYYTLTGPSSAISGISKATSAVVTMSSSAASNPFAVGENMQFSGVQGMTQINGVVAAVTAIGGSSGMWTATVAVNSSAFTTYTSGGTAGSGIPASSNSACSTANAGTTASTNCNTFIPAIDQGPGAPTSTGTYTLQTAATASQPNGIPVTLYPQGYVGGYYQGKFSSGDIRIFHLDDGNSGMPHGRSGANDPSTFGALTANATTSVAMNYLGDNFFSNYEGHIGTGVIWPGTSSFVYFVLHQYGPHGSRSDVCQPGASGTNEIPLPPDSYSTTGAYVRLQAVMYSMSDILNGYGSTCPIGSHAIYCPNPYDWGIIPGDSSLHDSNGCLKSPANGFMTYDPAGGKVYGIFQVGKYPNVVQVWSLSSM